MNFTPPLSSPSSFASSVSQSPAASTTNSTSTSSSGTFYEPHQSYPSSNSSPAPAGPRQLNQQQLNQHQQATQQALAYQQAIYHQQLVMNGLNGGQLPGGGAGGAGGMAAAVGPTPAGHPAELSYIYAMVDELSRQLADNKRALEDVVTGVGRVRNRARVQQLGNEELIAGGGDDLNAQDSNLDAQLSLISEAFEKAKYSRDANTALLTSYASALASMLKQFHDYKQRHVADVSAWHRSYRAQLAEARAENSALREQIWEMQARASEANEKLRVFRSKLDPVVRTEDRPDGQFVNVKEVKREQDAAGETTEVPKQPVLEKDKDAKTESGPGGVIGGEADQAAARRWERRVSAKAMRQELRFWRRMAMPELADDEACWSDDDDIVDPNEKIRLREIERKIAAEQLARMESSQGSMDSSDGEEGSEIGGHQRIPPEWMGGVPMQREDSVGSMGMGGMLGMGMGNMPNLPPRPPSANSTGSSGQ